MILLCMMPNISYVCMQTDVATTTMVSQKMSPATLMEEELHGGVRFTLPMSITQTSLSSGTRGHLIS